MKKIIILAMFLSAFLSCSTLKKSTGGGGTGGGIVDVDNMYPDADTSGEIDFTQIRGADVSSFWMITKNGGKFFDEKGIEKHMFEIMKKSGVNLIRIRVWKDIYSDSSFAGTLASTTVKNRGGGGYSDMKNALWLSKEAKRFGFKVLIAFHVSDIWGDSSGQWVPDEWKNMTHEEIRPTLYNYIYDELTLLKDAGLEPAYVQVGNEVDEGFLFASNTDLKPSSVVGQQDYNYGRYARGAYTGEPFTNFVTLQRYGIKAVRDVFPNVKVLVQLSSLLQTPGFTPYFDRVLESLNKSWTDDPDIFSGGVGADIDYDVMGGSLYPMFNALPHNIPRDFQFALDRGKEVLVVEVSHAFTLDAAPTIIRGELMFRNSHKFVAGHELRAAPYKATIAWQEQLMKDLWTEVDKVDNLEDDIIVGIIYWEPAWMAVGWDDVNPSGPDNPHPGYDYEGSQIEWSNQALFSFEGYVHPGMKALGRDKGPK